MCLLRHVSREGRSNIQGLMEQSPLQHIPLFPGQDYMSSQFCHFQISFCFHTFVIWQLNSSPSPQLLNIGIGKIRQVLTQILFSEFWDGLNFSR